MDGHTDGCTYGRMDVPTDGGRTFPPLMLLARLGRIDLKTCELQESR